DFGTGRIVWADLSMSAGATLWNATVDAATGLGLDLNVTWYNATPFLNDIGGAHPSWPDYWHFLIWNVSRWDFADLGPADLPPTRPSICRRGPASLRWTRARVPCGGATRTSRGRLRRRSTTAESTSGERTDGSMSSPSPMAPNCGIGLCSRTRNSPGSRPHPESRTAACTSGPSTGPAGTDPSSPSISSRTTWSGRGP